MPSPTLSRLKEVLVRFAPWLVFAAATAWLFGPFLFFPDRLITSTYSAKLLHVFYLDGQNFLIHTLGGWPNWWPAFSMGYPISLTLDGFLNPIFVVALKLFPVLFAHNWMVAGFFFLNLASCYAFFRALGIGKAGSMAAAVTYGFNGLIVQWTGVLVFASIMPILPLSFLAVLRISQGSRRWWIAWTALLTYGWIGGFAELMVYYLIAIGAFAAYLLFRNPNGVSLWRLFLQGIKKYLAPVLLSVLFVSPWLISILYFILRFSNRGTGIALEEASSLPLTLSHLVHLFLPRLFIYYGNSLPIPMGGPSESDLYIGILPLILLVTLFWTRRKVTQKHFWFFVGLFAFAILMAFRSPLYLLLQPLPVISWFRWHFKWSFLSVFAVSALVGYAFDAYLTSFKTVAVKRLLIVCSAVLGLVAAGFIAFTVFAPAIQNKIISYGDASFVSHAASVGRSLPRDPEYYRYLIRLIASSVIEQFSLTNAWTLFALLSWILALVLLLLAYKGKISSARLSWMMVGAILLTNAGMWTGFMAGHTSDFLLKEPDTAAFLHAQNAYRTVPVEGDKADTEIPYRVYNFFPDQTIALLQQQTRVNLYNVPTHEIMARELLDRNINTWFRIDGAFNHEPLADRRIVEFLYFINGTTTHNVEEFHQTIRHFSSEQNVRFLGAMNVKYVLTPIELAAPWKLVHTSPLFENKINIYVYENPLFLPRWHFADEALWRTPTSTDLDGLNLMKDIGDFSKTVLVDRRSPSDGAEATSASPDDRLVLERYAAGSLKLRTKTNGYRWIYFGETAIPFWRARIDGAELSVYRANAMGQAVLVPPGEHEVEFFYPGFWEQARESLASFIGHP